jgi:hypothetical protein
VIRRLLALLLLAATAGTAAASTRASGSVTIPIPSAQSVAVEAVKLKSAVPATALKLEGTSAAPRATAMVAVKGNTLFIVTVNRSGRPAKLTLTGASAASTRSLVDAGRTPLPALSRFAKSVGGFLGWNPIGSPESIGAAGVDVRTFDAAHPAGRALASKTAVAAAEDTRQLLISPNIAVRDDIYKQIDTISGCILGRVTCGKYLFTFTGLTETVYRADQPNYRLTTTYSGHTCGRTLEGQQWTVTAKSTAGKKLTKRMNFRKSPVVYVTAGKINGSVGTAIHKLAPLAGAFPQMEVLVDSTGGWSSNAGARIVPVAIAKAKGC